MLDGAPDQALIDLGDHVGFHTTQKPTRIDPPFWSKGMLRLFITHLSSHREYAAELKNDLQNYGISCFVAHNDIEPTLEWQAEIESALATCDALIALLHPDFHKSSWTDQEIGFAMGRGVPVCSVRFGDDPYGFVSRFQAFNGMSKKAAVLAKELFDAYRKNKQTQARMADAIVSTFVDSRFFAQAKEFMGHLEELQVWDPSYAKRLHSAVKNNHQVAESFGVPDRVARLIKKWAKKG